MFRSGTNTHRLWPSLLDDDGQAAADDPAQGMLTGLVASGRAARDTVVQAQLAEKRRLAAVWGCVCPAVEAYCRGKKKELEDRLRRFARLETSS